MLKTKHEKGIIISFYAIAAVFMLVASFFDLQINQLLYYPNNPFGVFLDRIGELPPYVAVALALTALFRFPPKLKKWATALLKAIFGIASVAVWIYIFIDFGDKWIIEDENRLIFEIIFGLITGFLSLYLSKYLPEKHMSAFRNLAVFFILIALLTSWPTSVLKDIWGRIRFRDLVAAGSYDGFTPWYIIAGKDGRSFPSGHTTGAAATFMLMGISYFFPSQKENELKYYIAAMVFTFAVGFSRITRGAHYLSDITFAAIIVFTLFLIIRYLYVKRSFGSSKKADTKN